jgi:hypothetical protein
VDKSATRRPADRQAVEAPTARMDLMAASLRPATLEERVTGIEPASRAWKAVSGRGPIPVPTPNAQVRADIQEPSLTAGDR